MRILSLAALTVLELAADEQIICANKTGYQAVGLRLIPATPTEQHTSLRHDIACQKRVKSLLASTGISVLDIEIFRLKPDTNVRDYLPYIELGCELGARNLLVAGNDSNWLRLCENWHALNELCQPLGIKPHIEPMPWTDIKSYSDGVKLVESHADKLGAVLIDPIHFFRKDGDITQITPEHSAKMGYMQLADAPMPTPNTMEEILRQAREDGLPPSVGDFPLIQRLQQLPNNLPISVEVPLSAEWACNSAQDKAHLVRQFTLELLAQVDKNKAL